MCSASKAESGVLDDVFLMNDEGSSTAFGGVYFGGFPNVGAIAVNIPGVLVMHCIKFK